MATQKSTKRLKSPRKPPKKNPPRSQRWETGLRKGVHPRTYTDELVIEALRKCGGLMTRAARMLHCNYAYLTIRVKNDPKMLEVMRECREAQLDEAEDALRWSTQRRQAWAVQYTLSRVGRSRGYISDYERVHMAADALPDIDNLSDEAIARLVESLRERMRRGLGNGEAVSGGATPSPEKAGKPASTNTKPGSVTP